MPTSRKTPASSTDKKSTAAKAAARNTDSGPANVQPSGDGDATARKAAETQAVAAAMPFNATKAAEHGLDNGQHAPAGASVAPPSRLPTASTLSESNSSAKTGGVTPEGSNPTTTALDRVRVDGSGQRLTTNQGVPIADNQNSLKAGLRGPVLLEDFILREKITHFDHERIPERIVHARGSGAHGFFECYQAVPELTRAAPFQQDGKITPVFVRFSTVQGERGSKDTARDVR
ncbi:MAG TPA: catalase, partial [Roseateles sp.]